MSDEDNEYNEDGILDEEEKNIEDNYIIRENINKILLKNQINIDSGNEGIISEIKKLHQDLNIYDEQLMEEIEKCIQNKIVDISFIKTVSEYVAKTKFSDKIHVLKELYLFICDPELEKNNLEKINKKFPELLNQIKPEQLNISLREHFLNIKINLVLEIFQINDKYMKKIIIECIIKNWNLSSIKTFQVKLKDLIPSDEKNIKDKNELIKIKIENEQKIYIMKSLLETITAFPIDNLVLELNDIDFSNKETIAREFYLKCATTSKSQKKALETDELLRELENRNPNYFSKVKLKQFKFQMIKAKKTRKPQDYNNWVKTFKRYNFNSNKKNEYIAEALGVISCGLEDTRKFPLREAQILAILIFIDNYEIEEEKERNEEQPKNEIIIENEENQKNNHRKKDKGKGIIEQISTGEGKSAIISCLAVYFCLRNHRVDIITSSRTLASRDSLEFKEFYKLFDLDTDSAEGYQAAPYKANITYGTFLDFEGDLLDEMTSNKEIRGNRPFDIIIIDEVDNAFIDCIRHSTQLTRSSKGYQFLIPMYVSIYMMVDLLDHAFLEESIKKFNEVISQEEFKNLDDESKRNIYEEISDNERRKDVFLKYIEKFFEDFKTEVSKNDSQMAKELKGSKIDFNKILNLFEETSTPEGLKKYLMIPKYLLEFVEVQIYFWSNSAFVAKNMYSKDIDYTISYKTHDGYANVTPIDRKNTGELEFNSVYRNGLHQMLQIKENIRVKPETLTHTFLSHITYFTKFKKKNFFGLTGTIGGEVEKEKIYGNIYFNSNLVYIPSYMAKRFIELPALICDENKDEHIKKICDEICYHFSKGRKILVICKDIKEGDNIEHFLKSDIFKLNEKDIFSYVRNDIDDIEENLRVTERRIIISTNLGGRGTDIKTSIEQEKNGGLHVIITKLSSNSRTQQQAFGRTSRQGNKGSGQFIITQKKNLKTYDQLIHARDRKEKEMLDEIDLEELLLKDELFKEYIDCLKKYPELKKTSGFNTREEIDERWSFFLKKNFRGKINEEKIRKNFEEFKYEIKRIMSLPRYKRFNNDFLRITDAFMKDDDEERLPFQEIIEFLSFENCDQCFYFAASYLKAYVQWQSFKDNFLNDYNDKSGHCKEMIKNFEMAQKQLKILILLNIEPTLKSILIYQKISGNKYFKKIDDYNETAFYKQFETRKKILNNLIEHIDRNIKVTKDYIRNYLPYNIYYNLIELHSENVPIKKCLKLKDEEVKDLEYLYDASFDFTFELSIKKRIVTVNWNHCFLYLGYLISAIVSIFSDEYAERISDYITEKLNNIVNERLVDVNEDFSLIGKIKNMISSMFNEREEVENDTNIQNPNQDDNENDINNKNNKRSPENISKLCFIELKEKTLKIMKENIIKIFNQKIKDIKEELNFLVFIDCLFKEKTWNNIIIDIILKSFDTREMLLQKDEIIKLFNKESQYEKAIEKLTSEIDKALNNIASEIKSEFVKEGYEKNKVKRLEHIIIRKRFGDIDYKTAVKIVESILYQKVLDKNGKFNKDLFIKNEDKVKDKAKDKTKDKAKDKTKENKEEKKKIFIQYVNIFYETPMPKKFEKIKTIEDFTLKNNFKPNFEHDLILQDVQKLYFTKNYSDIDKRIFLDFTNGIKDIIKEIYELSTNEIISDKFDSFIKAIYEKIKTYLEEEILPNILMAKSKMKKKKLNKEEQRIVNLINESSREKAFDFMKYKNFGQVMD